MAETADWTLPAAWYRDAALYEVERRAVWGREWLAVARADQLREPGDAVGTSVAGMPIVVLVDGDGDLRAFHNVCRHRAGPLVDDGEARCRALVCRYHGWTYDLDGRLVRARDFGDDDLDLDEFGLWPLAVDRWRALVFVNVDLAAPPLADALGGFAAAAALAPMEELTFSHEVVHEIACNWKTYADNYLEGYHVPLVHPELNRELDVRRYRVDVHDRWCRHSAPARDGAVNTGTWLWRHPNLALSVYPDGMNVERWFPIGPERTQVVYQYWFRTTDPDDPVAARANADVVRISTEILDEDRRICEAVQRNLDAGVYDRGRLSPRHERGVAAFQRWVREAVEQAT